LGLLIHAADCEDVRKTPVIGAATQLRVGSTPSQRLGEDGSASERRRHFVIALRGAPAH